MKILAIITAVFLVASADEVVVPNINNTTEGSSSTTSPFNVPASVNNVRHQQVYASSAFAPANCIAITEVLFRPDETNGAAFNVTLPDVTISMSTTNNSVDGLTPVFDENLGADAAVVRSSRSLPLSSAATGGSPKDFDIRIVFDTTFSYSPAAGNLLLDVINADIGGIGTTTLTLYETVLTLLHVLKTQQEAQ